MRTFTLTGINARTGDFQKGPPVRTRSGSRHLHDLQTLRHYGRLKGFEEYVLLPFLETCATNLTNSQTTDLACFQNRTSESIGRSWDYSQQSETSPLSSQRRENRGSLSEGGRLGYDSRDQGVKRPTAHAGSTYKRCMSSNERFSDHLSAISAKAKQMQPHCNI